MAICTCGSDLVMAGQHESDCAVIASAQIVTFSDGPPCRLCQGSGIEADDVYGASTCTECWGTGVAKDPKPLRPRS